MCVSTSACFGSAMRQGRSEGQSSADVGNRVLPGGARTDYGRRSDMTIVGHPRRQNPLSRLEVVGDALRAQASLLDGPIGEPYGHVAVGHAVEPERLHLQYHRLLL